MEFLSIFEEVDEHGKHIVWDSEPYCIVVDDPSDATYITLWYYHDKLNGKRFGMSRVGYLSLSGSLKVEGKTWRKISAVEIKPAHRGNRFGIQLYKQALRFISPEYAGLVSYLPDQANNVQPPKIHRRLGGYVVDGDYSVIPR